MIGSPAAGRKDAVEASPIPAGALLQTYAETNAYTDCYSLRSPSNITLAEFMAAFYTTPIFKLERWLLSTFLGFHSTDQEASQLAQGKLGKFSAWQVEARDATQAILAAGRTRSWLMVAGSAAASGEGTTLFFGSAVVPRKRGGLGWQFSALVGLHRLYSRILLSAAARRLSAGPLPAAKVKH